MCPNTQAHSKTVATNLDELRIQFVGQLARLELRTEPLTNLSEQSVWLKKDEVYQKPMALQLGRNSARANAIDVIGQADDADCWFHLSSGSRFSQGSRSNCKYSRKTSSNL